MSAKDNLRNTKPISLAPLTPEEALRRAMNAPLPKDEPKKKHVKKKPKK